MATAEGATQGRREQILEATLRVIGRAGREAVTHRAVAEEAGVPLWATHEHGAVELTSRPGGLVARAFTTGALRTMATAEGAR